MWNAFHFLLNGEYCSFEDIRALLHQTREEDRADATMLIVFVGAFLQTSLFFSDGATFSLATELEAAIRRKQMSVEESTEVLDALDDLLVNPSKKPYALEILRQFLNIGIQSPITSASQTLVRAITSPFPSRPSTATSLLRAFTVSIRPLNRSTVTANQKDLYYALAGSVPIEGGYSRRRLDRVDRRLDRAVRLSLTRVFSGFTAAFRDEDVTAMGSPLAEDVITAIAKSFDCHSAAIYSSSVTVDGLDLVDSYGTSFLRTITVASDSSHVAYSFRNRVTLIVNSANRIPRILLGCLPASATDLSDSSASLIIPFCEQYFSGYDFARTGILILMRSVSDDVPSFGRHELLLAHRVAEKLALYQMRKRQLEATNLIELASSRFQRQSSIRSPAVAGLGGRRRSVSSVPLEYLGVANDMQFVLDCLCQATKAHFGVVRLLSPNQKLLSRAGVFPADGWEGVREAVSLNERVYSTHCLQYDVTIHHPNLQDPIPSPDGGSIGYLPHEIRGLSRSRSLFAAPLRVGSRNVGSVTIESPLVGGFTGMESIVHAFLEILERLLFSATNESISQVVGLTSRLLFSLHRLENLRLWMRELAAASGPTILNPSLVNEALMTLDEALTYRSASDDGSSGSPENVIALVKGVVAASFPASVKLAKGIEVQEHYSLHCDSVLASGFASVLRSALTEVMSNAANKVINDHGHRNDVRIDLRLAERVFGRKLIEISVTTTQAVALASNLEEKLYRVPYVDTAKRHLGAFLAGAMLRNIGGDVFVNRNDNRLFETILHVPYAENLS